MPGPLVVYDQVVEGLFQRGLEGQITPGLKARLREAGLDLDRKLQPSYPRERWVRFLQLAAEELYPTLSPSDAYWRLGERAVLGVEKTLLGRAQAALAKLLGPRRTLQGLAELAPAGNNFMKIQLSERAPRRCEIWFNDTYSLPTYMQGALSAVLRMAGAQEVKVEILQREDPGCAYLLEWSGRDWPWS